MEGGSSKGDIYVGTSLKLLSPATVATQAEGNVKDDTYCLHPLTRAQMTLASLAEIIR
jgi:hypothetical protein